VATKQKKNPAILVAGLLVFAGAYGVAILGHKWR